MSQRIIAIGDIHGCAAALNALLETLQPRSNDFIIPLGDYIDRGTSSRQVVDTLIGLQDKCQLVPLLGNHELMMLTALDQPSELDFWLRCGGKSTLKSYGGSVDQIPDEHIQFLKQCRAYFETTEHIFLHANYTATLPLDQQPSFTLFWEHLTIHTPERHVSGKTAIVGHTPQISGEILDLEHLICIDTFCVGGRWLTAMDVNTGQYWQVNNDGDLRES